MSMKQTTKKRGSCYSAPTTTKKRVSSYSAPTIATLARQKTQNGKAVSKEIMATYRAEKKREKVKEKAAGKYLRIRALLDQADILVAGAQLPRPMKNKFVAKILRARRELDFGDCPSKVSENLQDIVAILKKEVRDASKILHVALSSLKRDLVHIERRRERSVVAMTSKPSSLPQRLKIHKSATMANNVLEQAYPRLHLEYPRICPMTISTVADAGDSISSSIKTISLRPPSPMEKRNHKNQWFESEAEEDRKKMEVELSEECGTLDTLHFALKILNEMGRPDLSPKEVQNLETTMKKTKKMLLNRRECQKLRGPLESLQQAMELPSDEREELFCAALKAVHKVVETYEGR